MKHIVLTGGGTAGHVNPNLALLPALKEAGYRVSYIGSYNGIEKQLIEDAGIPYYGISTGKLRRYFDLKNISDPFRVLKGIREAGKLIKKLSPDIVFSKGGFVSVPVVMAAGRKKIPVILHESDMTLGLANKICLPFSTKVCCNFPETLEKLPKKKAVLTGTPIRQELEKGDAERGREFCHFSDDQPVILVMGGSLGAVAINKIIRKALPRLLQRYQVVHLCGKGNLDKDLENMDGYVQFEYIDKTLPDLFAMTSMVVSRAGANALAEIVALAKPNLLIPLTAAASRGDQILNARSFEKQGYSMLLEEENLNVDSLLKNLEQLDNRQMSFIHAMQSGRQTDAIAILMDLIKKNTK